MEWNGAEGVSLVTVPCDRLVTARLHELLLRAAFISLLLVITAYTTRNRGGFAGCC